MMTSYHFNLAEQVKAVLPMTEVAEKYGYHPNRAGFISCPFHDGDDTPSLKIYKNQKGFYCHACGAGYSVIDFVMRLFHISFAQAIVRLNADFGLGLINGQANPRQIEKLRKERREKEHERAIYEAKYMQKTETYRRLWRAKQTKAPKTIKDLDNLDPEYLEACHMLTLLVYWFDTHPYIAR